MLRSEVTLSYMSNNSVNLVLSAGVPSQEEALHLTHKDLLCFAWQIAKGMAYLADMKVSWMTGRQEHSLPGRYEDEMVDR